MPLARTGLVSGRFAAMTNGRAWVAAQQEHEAVVGECIAVMRGVPTAQWHIPRAPGKWSPAEEALHIVLAYAFGIGAVTAGSAMRLRVHPIGAFLSRTLLLPLVFRVRRFPRGAAAPPEVMPSAGEAVTMTIADATARLAVAAAEAARALREADQRDTRPRVVHAYFGALAPRDALRLLSAHTRHHTANLRGALATP